MAACASCQTHVNLISCRGESKRLTVSVFNSSVDACGKFSDAPDLYDLVILDHTMPRMTGLEVAKHVLKLRPDLPVVLYTGCSEEISEDRVSQAGIRALVRKPVDTHRLRDLIWRLLSGSALQ
jgi:CheY-like chemotaxis protein